MAGVPLELNTGWRLDAPTERQSIYDTAHYADHATRRVVILIETGTLSTGLDFLVKNIQKLRRANRNVARCSLYLIKLNDKID